MVLLDAADYERISAHRWSVKETRSGFVAVRRVGQAMILMHREVLGVGPSEPRMVDHINHNGLDNRGANLRLVTNAENQLNRRDQGRGYHHDARYALPWSVTVRFATEAEADAFTREHIPHRRVG